MKSIFGASPYVVGGDIRYKNNSYARYILIALVCIVVVYLLYRVFIQINIYDGETFWQNQMHKYFDQTNGDSFDGNAKKVLEIAERLDFMRPIDHFRVGTVQLVNNKNPVDAHKHFNTALQQVSAGMIDVRDTPFILDRINDFQDEFVDVPELADLPLQQAMQEYYQFMRKNEINNEKHKSKIKQISKGDPRYRQKLLLAKRKWHIDQQNVHDSNLHSELVEQFQKVKQENARSPAILKHDYAEVKDWLRKNYRADANKWSKISRALERIDKNYDILSIPNTKERDILVAVWRRSFHPANKENRMVIQEAIADSLEDCIEHNNLVCTAGRTAKIWQSLARVDQSDNSLGVVKTKEAIRNEIFEQSAKIVDQYVGKNGTARKELKKAYQEGEDTEDVKDLEETIKKDIKNMAHKYSDKVAPEQLDIIIDEAIAGV